MIVLTNQKQAQKFDTTLKKYMRLCIKSPLNAYKLNTINFAYPNMLIYRKEFKQNLNGIKTLTFEVLKKSDITWLISVYVDMFNGQAGFYRYHVSNINNKMMFNKKI